MKSVRVSRAGGNFELIEQQKREPAPGIARIRVSSGGWSNPSPTNLPVDNKTRGVSGASASSVASTAARCFVDERPCSVTKF